jgi:hypothetical protein
MSRARRLISLRAETDQVSTGARQTLGVDSAICLQLRHICENAISVMAGVPSELDRDEGPTKSKTRSRTSAESLFAYTKAFQCV